MLLWWIWLIIALVVILVVIFFSYYNRIIVLNNRIKNSWSQIDVQLKKRADLVPNLVETVKTYMKHERQLFTEIANARKEMISARDVKKKDVAGEKLGGFLKSLFAIAENYPKLRANENFLNLQEQLGDIENKVAYARQFYNDSVLSFNNIVKTIPGVWFASMMRKKEHPYLEIKSEERKPIKVKF